MNIWTYLLITISLISGSLSQLEERKTYVCPPEFIRHGNSCYLFSKHMATWQEAHFACRGLGAELARMERSWEDRNMRSYLNKPELARLERWIGGIYNWETKKWMWGASGRRMGYQGFSRRSPNADPTWHCTIMDPMMNYKWGMRSCVTQHHYICETPLKTIVTYDEPTTQAPRPTRRRHGRRKGKQRKLRPLSNQTTNRKRLQ